MKKIHALIKSVIASESDKKHTVKDLYYRAVILLGISIVILELFT